jgi:endonuclease III
MSSAPEKKPRTLHDVQLDYQNACLKAGQMQYQKAMLEEDLNMLNSAIKDINLEAAKLQNIAAEAAKLVAAQGTPSPAPEQPSTEQGNA